MSNLIMGALGIPSANLGGFSPQTSQYGTPVPIVYGTTRIAGNILDFPRFAALPVAGACLVGSTTTNVNTNLTQGAGFFDQGVIAFTSGANIGVTRYVNYYTSANVAVLATALPFAPATG